MTIRLEHISSGDSDAVRRNFERLRSLVPDTGGQNVSIRFGQDSVTWDGSGQTSTVTSVAHGLGRTPAAIVVTSAGGSTAPDYVFSAGEEDADSFNVYGATRNESTPAAATERFFWWVAVG